MAIKSKQPRLNNKEDTEAGVFLSNYAWLNDAEDEIVYGKDSRARDKWLREYAAKEPNLSGVISSVIAIDKNRGSKMVGGRNQVKRYTEMLHDMEVAPGLRGWRPSISFASRSFWSSDMGAVLEVGRDGQNGPMRGLYNVDPARCVLSGNSQYPLRYYPSGSGKMQRWREIDYLRVVSIPSTDETFNGLGYCAVSRCLELVKLMIAVYGYDKEQLGAKAPTGLLLLNGISQKQWDNAMKAREADLQSKDYNWFANVAVLASAAATVDAKLMALRSLPASFQLRDWMDMMIYGYALCFGYDPSEFWPVQFGALGRGTETEIQHEKATGKGRLDFVLGLQEQLQENLPDSLSFLFDQRDEKGDLLHAQVDQAWATFGKTLIDGQILIPGEVRVLLAEQNVIPRSWAPTADELSTDQENADNDPEVLEEPDPNAIVTEDPAAKKTIKPAKAITARVQDVSNMLDARDILMNMSSVRRAIEYYPDEELVEYKYPENTYSVICRRTDDLLQRRTYPVIKVEEEDVKMSDVIELMKIMAAKSGRQIDEGYAMQGQTRAMVRMEENGMNKVMRISTAPDVVVNIPDQPTPTVSFNPIINIPAPIVNVEAPNVQVDAPNVDVAAPNVQVDAPVINVQVPEQKTPIVNVTVPKQDAPIVNVQPGEMQVMVEEPKSETYTVQRDPQGRIKSMKKEK